MFTRERRLRMLGSRPANHPFPLVSWLIRLFEWSNISHVGIVGDEVDSKVYNGYFTAVLAEEKECYLEKHKIVEDVTIKVTEEEYEKCQAWLQQKTGPTKGYFTTLFGALIPQMIRGLSFQLIMLPNLGIGTKGYTCSWLLRDMVNECLDQPRPMFINRRVSKECYTTTDVVKLFKTIAE